MIHQQLCQRITCRAHSLHTADASDHQIYVAFKHAAMEIVPQLSPAERRLAFEVLSQSKQDDVLIYGLAGVYGPIAFAMEAVLPPVTEPEPVKLAVVA